jgi:hypothetical protein
MDSIYVGLKLQNKQESKYSIFLTVCFLPYCTYFIRYIVYIYGSFKVHVCIAVIWVGVYSNSCLVHPVVTVCVFVVCVFVVLCIYCTVGCVFVVI